MEIAILGAGNVGGALGRRWAAGGHLIAYGVRDPEADKVRSLLTATGGNARAESPADAAADAEVVVLATPWSAAESVIASAGDLGGKIVVDCCNALLPNMAGLALGPDTSAGELVAQWARGARVVKAFNTTGSGNMTDPEYDGGAITMPICGDDDNAKGVVAELAEEIGFEVIDAGGIRAARQLEAMAMFWIHLAYGVGLGPNVAIKIVRR